MSALSARIGRARRTEPKGTVRTSTVSVRRSFRHERARSARVFARVFARVGVRRGVRKGVRK
eukprot:1022545-Pyramimonas_sp.AAC.2